MLASMLGFILTIIIVGFISVWILASVIAFAKKTDKSEILSNSVLQIKLNQQINDRADNSPFATFQNKKTIGLNEILNSIKEHKRAFVKTENVDSVMRKGGLGERGLWSLLMLESWYQGN